jgi:mRNA interferase MazF
MAGGLWHYPESSASFGHQHSVRGRDRALIGVVPHTTATRGSQFEVSVPTRFLGEGAFLVQGIQALPPKYFLRRLGILTPDQIRQVEQGLLHWQGISSR